LLLEASGAEKLNEKNKKMRRVENFLQAGFLEWFAQDYNKKIRKNYLSCSQLRTEALWSSFFLQTLDIS